MDESIGGKRFLEGVMEKDDLIRLRAQLVALDYMVAQATAMLHRLMKTPPEAVLEIHRQARLAISQQSPKNTDPVMADHVMAEVQLAIEAIQSSVEANLGIVQPKRSTPRDQ